MEDDGNHNTTGYMVWEQERHDEDEDSLDKNKMHNQEKNNLTRIPDRVTVDKGGCGSQSQLS